MKAIRNIIIAIALIMAMPMESKAQWGWEAGQYYQRQGQRIKEYDQFYRIYYPGGYEVRYRILQWERVDYSGYINVWNGIGWSSQWQSSWAWYCYWSRWYYEFWRY